MLISASENSGNESNVVPRPDPDVTNGATFHSCEHCRDFTTDFGLSTEEMEEIIVCLTGKSPRKLKSTKGFASGLEELRELKGRATIISITGAQICQKARVGCELYAYIISSCIGGGLLEHDSTYVLFAHFIDGELELIYHHPIMDLVWRLTLFVPDDNPLSKYILGRPFPVDPWSESTRELVRQWMRTCGSPHDIRQPEEDYFSPTHLIELSPCLPNCSSECSSECCGFTLRLKKSIQGPVSYAALSYCWGGDQRLKATKSNIHELLNNIPYAEMPATLQDAAKVAFDLNFRYIWIDALCLIQDLDIGEVHTLIAEIPDIYRYATLTIAAQSSHDVGEGFLHPRDIRKCIEPGVQHLYQFQIAIKNLDGKSGFAMLLSHIPCQRTPINDRGWTLQEHLLSQNYLSFSNLMTHWRSYNGFRYEYGQAENLSRRQFISNYLNPHVLAYQGNIDSLSETFHSNERHSLWAKLIREYTSRSLSNAKDRPIAISALANVFGNAQDYIAGLWLSNIWYSLCWHCSLPSEVTTGYYAPSWSWWSVQGTVSWIFDMDKMHQDSRFRLVHYESKLAHLSAPFGYLVGASLRVKARCGEVFVGAQDLGERGPKGGLRLNYGNLNSIHGRSEGVSHQTRISWDRVGMHFQGHVLRILVMFVSLDGYPMVFGLLLVDDESGENEHERICRRVGTLHATSNNRDGETGRFIDWLKEQPVETLTLV